MQMCNPNPPRQGLSGPVRLVIVGAGLAVGAWLLVPLYVESFGEIRQQLRNASAPRHDLPGRQVIHCTPDWFGHMHCDDGSTGARNHWGTGEPADVFGFRRGRD